jgi:hypothetical protein
MALQLKTPHPARGAQWVREAFRLFGRKPLAFTGLFAAFLFAALLTVFVPYLGGLLQMMLLPLLSLGFMVASASALAGGPVHPGQYIEPLTADPRRRRSLLILCAAYGLSAVALLLLCNWVSDGKLIELQRVLGTGDARPEDIEALTADRGVFVGTVVAIVGATLLSVPFWHAPALVHWGGQSVGHALFSSTLAVWRAKGAFLVYALSWFAVIALFGFVTAVGLGLLGVPQLAGVLALPAGLVFSTVFYVSLIFSFNDSFGQAPSQTPAQATEPGNDTSAP